MNPETVGPVGDGGGGCGGGHDEEALRAGVCAFFCVETKITQMEEKITSYYSEKKSIKKIKANITSSQQIIVFKRIFSPIMASFAAPDRWKPPITA